MSEGNTQSSPTDGEPVGWRYNPTGGAVASTAVDAAAPTSAAEDRDIQWSASEYIRHQKSFGWYALLGLAAVVLAAVVYLVTRDMFSTVVVIIFAVIFGVSASLKPRTLTYHMTASALRVGTQLHPFSSFKSFAIVKEGAFSNIVLVPLKRFALPLGVYYPPEEEQHIIEALSRHLPLQPASEDALDRFFRRIHF